MSDSPRESDAADLPSGIVGDTDQLQPEDTLDGELGEDVLDTGYVTDDRPRADLAGFDDEDETIEDRIRQEVPDPTSAYGAPDNESGLDVDRVGGDDPDAIDADQDWIGDDAQVGEERAGRLVAPDEGDGPDVEKEALGEDVGVDAGAASAEEAAVHVVVDDEGDEADL